MQTESSFYILAEIGGVAAWWGIGGTLIGALISGFCAHYLTKDRDVRMRKAILEKESDVRRREFRKFIVTSRSRLDRIDHKDERAVWVKYTELAPEIRGEAALVEADYSDASRFSVLIETAAGWGDAALYQEARQRNTNIRDVICDSIDAIITFTKNAA